MISYKDDFENITDYRIFRPMKQSKLIVGLQMLEKEDWFSFRKYLLMYCSKTSDNYQLVDVLHGYKTKLSTIEDRDEIRKQFFSTMSVKSFSNLMSRIFIWFEEWLVWNESKKDSIATDVQLVKIYNRKGVYSLADKTYKRVENKLLNESQLDLATHKHLYQLHHYHYFSDNPVKYKRQDEILGTLMQYFFLQLKEQALLYIPELHNWGVIQGLDYSSQIQLLSQFGSLIQDSETSKVIKLIESMVIHLDKDSFLTLKKVVLSGQLKKDSDLYVIASLYMITFSLRLWNHNKIFNPQVILDVYDYGLESGVLLSTGKIPVTRFLNWVATFGYFKKSEKTYEFIDKWIHLVDTKYRDSVHSMAYAQLKMIEKKYDEIIPLLNGKKFDTEFTRLKASAFELVSLYIDRKNNYNLLMNRLDNFKRVLRKFSKRGKDNTARYTSNFVKVLEMLIRRDFIKLTINIEKHSPVMFKKWLIEEIEAGQQ